MADNEALLRTPLYATHKAAGAKMVPFGGWDMPVLYSGVIEEHNAVRERVGLFDVSHMGEIEIKGSRTLEVVQEFSTNDAAALKPGQAQYSTMLNHEAGIVDDIILYKISDTHFFICVNASNKDKDFQWMRERSDGRAEVIDRSSDYGLVALQGPRAQAVLAPLTNVKLDALAYYHFERGKLLGDVDAIVARTGYTGEDGFELFVPDAATERVWNALMEAGESEGIAPCGLGARDTLRVEMKYALYGHELTDQTNPLEAGLGWVVKFDKGNFVGRVPLVRIRDQGLKRKLVGFEMTGRGIARDGYEIFAGDKQIGHVTSGTMSPTLKRAVGIGYVQTEFSKIGAEFDVQIRKNRVSARVVKTPFYPGRVKKS